ncbi:hypothetical protein GCM10027093_27360 [Paraburkholderia jirisanensis]
MQLLSDELESENIILSVSMEEALPSMNGDRLRLQQVLLNLMTSCIEAMRTTAGPRELTVTAKGCGTQRVCIEIIDTGPHIAAGILDGRDPTQALIGCEWGMELLICHSIIEAHGGTLVVRRRERQGMSYAFDLQSMAGIRDR